MHTLLCKTMSANALVLLVAVFSGALGSPFQSHRFLSSSRVVGGSLATEGEIPWQVSIETTENNLYCGGSIINSEWIVTAAACSRIVPSYFQIRSGSLALGAGGVLHRIEEIIEHPEYRPFRLLNDIAVMRVSPPIEFDNISNQVTLPEEGEQTDEGTVVTVSGWGSKTYGGPYSTELLKADVTIVSYDSCNETYGGIGDGQICAGTEDGARDACQGDSGGPLFTEGVLIGIVSYGKGCGSATYPGVYTEVSAYVGWIMDSIADTNRK